MRLTCIRHGTTPMNVAGRFNGSSQESITDSQREALRRVEFDHSGFDVIYCSDLARCIETAIALGISEWRTDPRIRERHLGVFEGLTPSECKERYAEEYEAFAKFDADYVIPHGESRAQNLARVLVWLEEAAHYDEVLAVTHGGTIDFMYRLGTGLPLHGGDRIFAGSNASVSTFEVNWPGVRLLDYDLPII